MKLKRWLRHTLGYVRRPAETVLELTMGLMESLTAYFSRDSGEGVPEGLCVNCWGHQEYDGKIRSIARDRQVDINNGVERDAFIQAFVIQHVDGIRLQNTGSGLVCPSCKRVHPAP